MFYFTNLAFMGLPGGTEFIVIALIALLLFGSRLPKVAKGLGRSIVEFKKGIKGVGDEIEDASDQSAPSSQPPAGKSEASDDEADAGAPPPPDGGSPHREKGDLSNPGEAESS